MKTTQTILILASLATSSLAFASDDLSADNKRKAALDICLAEAKSRYGLVSENSEPKKKKIGRIKGHAYKLTVGTEHQQIRVNCIADANGNTMFYKGRI